MIGHKEGTGCTSLVREDIPDMIHVDDSRRVKAKGKAEMQIKGHHGG